jgi:predicted transcriptional regulator
MGDVRRGSLSEARHILLRGERRREVSKICFPSLLQAVYDVRHKYMTCVILIYFTRCTNSGETLILPCETASKVVIPAIRAYVARELIESYELKQDEVAKILGITQSAVSKYTSHVRGNVLRIDGIKEIQPLLIEMVTLVANGNNFSRTELLEKFCRACQAVRRTGLICPLCKKADASIEIQGCSYCLE